MGEARNVIAGTTKRKFGRATGNRKMEAKGTLQEGVGKVQGAVRRAVTKVESEYRRKKATRPPQRKRGERY